MKYSGGTHQLCIENRVESIVVRSGIKLIKLNICRFSDSYFQRDLLPKHLILNLMNSTSSRDTYRLLQDRKAVTYGLIRMTVRGTYTLWWRSTPAQKISTTTGKVKSVLLTHCNNKYIR